MLHTVAIIKPDLGKNNPNGSSVVTVSSDPTYHDRPYSTHLMDAKGNYFSGHYALCLLDAITDAEERPL